MVMPRILFITENGDSASSLYRAVIPAKGLRMLGYNVDVSNVLMERNDHYLVGLTMGREKTPKPHVVIARRMNGPNGRYIACEHMITRAIDKGQKVYFDLDDDPWNLPDHNPAFGSMSTLELAQWYRDMEACTGVICATDALAETVRANTSVTNIAVLPSGIDASAFTRSSVSVESVPLRLGWLGTVAYRGRDLVTIADVLRETLSHYVGKVELWHLGSLPNDPVTLEDLLDPFPVPIVKRPWVTVSDLPSSLAQIDSAILPMEDTLFNESRSITTGLALMAAGVPFASSSTREYRKLWRMGGGLVVTDTKGWASAISTLVDSAYVNARSDMRTAGLQLAREAFSPMKTAARYRALFNG